MGSGFEFVTKKDEWTPALKKLSEGLDAPALRRFWGDMGMKLVLLIKVAMDNQVGLERKQKYRKLKIKWRYHGRKQLQASQRNLNRRIRGTMTAGGQVTVASKTRVGPETVALQDTRQLYRSWSVLQRDAAGVTVGNRTPAEKLKAVYNDDRGKWDWGKEVSDKMLDHMTEYADKLLGAK